MVANRRIIIYRRLQATQAGDFLLTPYPYGMIKGSGFILNQDEKCYKVRSKNNISGGYAL